MMGPNAPPSAAADEDFPTGLVVFFEHEHLGPAWACILDAYDLGAPHMMAAARQSMLRSSQLLRRPRQ